jgi:hypothetical protein
MKVPINGAMKNSAMVRPMISMEWEMDALLDILANPGLASSAGNTERSSTCRKINKLSCEVCSRANGWVDRSQRLFHKWSYLEKQQ